MIRTQIQLYDEQVKWLKQEAVEKGVSMSHLIRKSIDRYRSQIEDHRQFSLQKENALNVVGRFSSKRLK